MEVMAKILVLLVILLLNCIDLIRSECGDGSNCDPNNPNSMRLTIQEMCELVPDRGSGQMDIVRVYYNPVLQQCLTFSWSGKGGNANRFISIKNCYEICHPSDPGIRKIKGSGIRPYLTERKPPHYCDDSREGIPELGIPPVVDKQKQKQKEQKENSKDVVVRQMAHPYDPTKTLTIVQPVSYVYTNPNEPPRVIIEKHIRHIPTYVYPQQNPYYSQFPDPYPNNNIYQK